jgi:hypothetical protein
VTAGYGAGGGQYAFEFSLPDGQLADTGFLKLFVSTKFVDLGWISQMSPFHACDSARLANAEVPADIGIWDASYAVVTVYTDQAMEKI